MQEFHVITAANRRQFLDDIKEWSTAEPGSIDCLAYELLKNDYIHDNDGFEIQLAVGGDIDGCTYLHLAVKPVGMFAILGVELSNTLITAGFTLMCSEHHLHLHWPPADVGYPDINKQGYGLVLYAEFS